MSIGTEGAADPSEVVQPRRRITVPASEDGLEADVRRAVEADPRLFSTAVHEAGHVLMGWLVSAELTEATIVPRREWVPSEVGLFRLSSTNGQVTFEPLGASQTGLLKDSVFSRGGLMAVMVGAAPLRLDYGRAIRHASGDLQPRWTGLGFDVYLEHLLQEGWRYDRWYLFRDAEDLLRAAVGEALQRLQAPLLQVAVALVTYQVLDGEELKQLRGICAKDWQSCHAGDGSQDPFDGTELLKNLALELDQLVAESREAALPEPREYEPWDRDGAVEDEPSVDDAEPDEEWCH
jgi:hypothetical protein